MTHLSSQAPPAHSAAQLYVIFPAFLHHCAQAVIFLAGDETYSCGGFSARPKNMAA